MKKGKHLIFCIFTLMMCLCLTAGVWSSIGAGAQTVGSDFYYSTSNAPVFYGATKITVSKNAVSEFDVKDSRFRLFARDFEDGDLTPVVTDETINVDITTPGTYYVHYSVTDSHENTSTIEVPIIVNNDEEHLITVERTLHTIPDDWNMRLVGFRRNNNGDRQHLGIFLPAGQSFKLKVLEGLPSGREIGVSLYNNMANHENNTVLRNSEDGAYTEYSNYRDAISSTGQEAGYHDCVPLITSFMLDRGQDVNTVQKIELQYDATLVPALDYYLYGDNEEAFKTKWAETGHSFGIVEGPSLVMVLPYGDMNAYQRFNNFDSYDAHLLYYKRVIDRMDYMVGLDMNPTDPINQNFVAKYCVKANAQGGGGAYYSGSHIAVSGASMYSFFQMNWGGLHELAHGYQGSLGGGTMGLGEVSNNILGHYIQIDKTLYTDSSDWLGNMETSEAGRNRQRLEGRTFTTLQGDEAVGVKLYAIINLFDSFEGADTYRKMFRYYREKVQSGEIKTNRPNQEVYAEFFKDVYDTNILPYWNQWGLAVSEETVIDCSTASKSVSILEDSAGDKTDEILDAEGKKLRYGLVEDTVLQEHGVVGTLKINIDIANKNDVTDKIVLLEKNGNVIYKAFITNGIAEFYSIDAGSYYVRMPVLTDYSCSDHFFTVEAGQNQESVTYTALQRSNYHPSKLIIKGIHGTLGCSLTLSNNNLTGTVKLGQADLGNRNPTWTNRPEEEFIHFLITDDSGAEVYRYTVLGNNYFTETTVSDIPLELGYNYTVEIYTQRPRLVHVQSLITNTDLAAFDYPGPDSAATLRYKITKEGFVPDYLENFSPEDALYDAIRDGYKASLDELKQFFDDNPETLTNKYLEKQKKSQYLDLYFKLQDVDKTPYKVVAEGIMAGGKPTITIIKDNVTIDQYTIVDYKLFISATDNEDGTIALTNKNFSATTAWDGHSAGDYNVTLRVTDSDKNSSSVVIRIHVLERATSNPGDQTNPGTDSNDQKPAPTNKNLPIILVASVVGILVLFCIAIVVMSIVKRKKK